PMFRGTPFSYYWPSLRKEVQIVKEEDLMEPFMSVNDDVLTLRTGFHRRRLFALMPFVILFTAASIFAMIHYPPSFGYLKEYAIGSIQFRKKNIEKATIYAEDARKNGNIEEYNTFKGYIEDDLKEIEVLEIYAKKQGSVTIFTHLEALAASDDGSLGDVIDGVFSLLELYLTTLLLWFFLL
ncbi:hypothetical protein, partial [Vibrio azureus]